MMRVLVALGVVWLLAAPALAQTATVSGTIIDQSSAAVPGATVTLVGMGGSASTTSGSRGEYSFRNLQSGAYRITVTLVGFSPAENNDVSVGSGDVQLPAIILSVASLRDTVVVSASRSATALPDAPATLSVIDRTVLESTPAQNFGDLLRTLPGVNVVQLSARDINVSTRDAPSALANSSLVLLDDRPIFEDFFGLVLWDSLPTNMADVKQIEVVRGPASAVWGGNALTGVVNVVTKSPREAPGTTVSFSVGAFSRDAGSTVGKGAGALFGANATVAHAPNTTWSYRISAGYFDSAPLPRPTGRIPLIPNPNNPLTTVGGGLYPIDASGPPGTAFQNAGTSQPKFDTRVDQEIADGRITYASGIAGTSGIIYGGFGPFDIQKGSYTGYAKVNYQKRRLKVNAFTNFTSAKAPNLLLVDPATQQPLQLTFATQTYDVEFGDTVQIGSHHVLVLGGNVRRNNFEVSSAPAAENRTDLGAYAQDEVLLSRVRLTLGGRIDKFGNQSDPVFSPRLAAVLKLIRDHSLRVSYNRAFRSPSPVYNYLDVPLVSPTDLSALAPLLPIELRPLVAAPFPLIVHLSGSDLPLGGAPQPKLTEESLTAYEVAYTGTFNRKTTIGAAAYVNDLEHGISLAYVPSGLDPYTATNPPPGWQLPASTLTVLAQSGIFLPRTAFTYMNLRSQRQKGVELSIDHRVTRALIAFANYSWQAKPITLGSPNPLSATEAPLPPTNRFNIGFNFDGSRLLGSASLNYVGKAFWSDVLSSPYHGFTDAYTMLNGLVGMKWAQGRVTTLVRGTNLTNRDIKQHVFGDIIKRSVVAEVRFSY